MAKTVSGYIIGIIIFTLFIFGGVAMISEFVSVDDTFISGDDGNRWNKFNSTFNKYNNIKTTTSDLENSLSSDAEQGVFGVLNGLINTAWNTITTTVTALSFMTGAFNGLTYYLGIPNWVISLVISLITIILVFAIFGAIFQREI